MYILVSGGAGRTGRLVYNRLLQCGGSSSVKALVRREEKGLKILGCEADLLVVDVTNRAALFNAFTGVSALVLLTSAVPVMTSEGPPPTYGYLPGGEPEAVDWRGAVNQIDGAKAAGVKHIVMVGGMGATYREGRGGIVRWKHKAKLHLVQSGVPYTIINPAWLRDGEPGQRQLIIGKNDDIHQSYDKGESFVIRADVARVVVAALTHRDARNKAFDLASHNRPAFAATKDNQLIHLFRSATEGI